jgi:glycosyltransferase involved in cell wall biosynthesis
MKPTVSVMMTAFNHQPFIRQAVESAVSQQTGFPIEIVIGEDCSADHTRDILQELQREHPKAIRLLLREENWGRRRNFMDVLDSCRGTYVAILEGDDYWTDPHKLQLQVELLERRTECALSFHPVIKHFEPSGFEKAFYPPGRQSTYTVHDLLERNFIATCSVVFRNRLFDPFPDWFQHVPAGDWPLHVLNAQHGDIAYLDRLMGVHRIHPGGVWSPKSAEQRLRAKIEVLDTMYRNLPPALTPPAARGLHAQYLQLIWIHLRRLDRVNLTRTMAAVKASDAVSLGGLARRLPGALRRAKDQI